MGISDAIQYLQQHEVPVFVPVFRYLNNHFCPFS